MADEKKEETTELDEETVEKEQSTKNTNSDEVAKLKTENELLNKQIGQLSAEIERLKQSMSFFQKPSQSQTSEEETTDLSSLFYENPEKAVNIITRKIEEKITPQIQQVYSMIQAEQLRQYFYSKYPDLKGYEKLVGITAQEITSKNPNMPIEEVLALIAKQTREYIASLRGPTTEGKKIYTEGASKKPVAPSEGEKEIIYNPEEELKQELEFRQKFQQQKLGAKKIK